MFELFFLYEHASEEIQQFTLTALSTLNLSSKIKYSNEVV